MLAALRLASPDRNALDEAPAKTRGSARSTFVDRTQLTLALGLECREQLPDVVRAPIDRHLANNAERWERTQATYRELASAFDAKGSITRCSKASAIARCSFAIHATARKAISIFYFRSDQVRRAQDAAARLGYEPIKENDQHPTDHLPTLIRKTGWVWRGDTVRSRDAPVTRVALPALESAHGTLRAEGAGLFLGAPPEQGTGGTAIHQSSFGRCDRILGLAFAAASAARRRAGVSRLRTGSGAASPRG